MNDKTATPAPTISRSKSTKNSSGHHSILEHRFFVVGLIWLVFALGLVLYVIFGPPLCSPLQIKTFATVLSLSAGFLAWTFSGAISAQTRNVIPGIAIVATGGFAVFLILQLQFSQDDMQTLDPRCAVKTQHDDDGLYNYYSEIAVHTSNVVQQLTEAKTNSQLNQQVFDQALTLRTKIARFPETKIDELQKAILSLYAAQASTALAVSLTPVNSNVGDGMAYAKEAREHASSAIKQLTKLMADPGKQGRAAVEHASKYKSVEKAEYLSGIAQILSNQWANLGNVKAEYSDENISMHFKQIPATFLKEISAASDPPIMWFCKVERKELTPCSKL